VAPSDLDKIEQIVGRAIAPVLERLDKVDSRLDKVDSRLDKVDSRLDKVDASIERLEDKTDALIVDVHNLQAEVGGINDKLVIIEEKHDRDVKQIKDYIGLTNAN